MSYLTANPASLPNFTQMVFSCWFRIPTSTFASALDDYTKVFNFANGPINSVPPENFFLGGIIPIFTWGDNNATFNANVNDPDGGNAFNVSPSFVGIQLSGDPTSGDPITYELAVRFQYNTFSYGYIGQRLDVLAVKGDDMIAIGDQYSIVATSALGGANPIVVAPDVWHHVLISATLGSVTVASSPDSLPTVSTSCKLYIALDDVNYNGSYLWPSGVYSAQGAGDANAVIPTMGWFGTGAGGGGAPYTFDASGVPCSGFPAGVPCYSSDHVYELELAELQFFTGVSLNTGDVGARRAFVDGTGAPVDPSAAIAFLSKEADYLFHGVADFTSGHQSGTSGDVFDDTGLISAFSPQPKLGV